MLVVLPKFNSVGSIIILRDGIIVDRGATFLCKAASNVREGCADFQGIRKWIWKLERSGGDFMNNRTIRRKKRTALF